MDSEELDFITDRRARKAIIEAGYDSLGKAYAAGEEVITDLRYVGRLTWEEIEAEELRQARAEMEAVDDQPPGEPAILPLPPVVYEPPPGDPQEVPEDAPETQAEAKDLDPTATRPPEVDTKKLRADLDIVIAYLRGHDVVLP